MHKQHHKPAAGLKLPIIATVCVVAGCIVVDPDYWVWPIVAGIGALTILAYSRHIIRVRTMRKKVRAANAVRAEPTPRKAILRSEAL